MVLVAAPVVMYLMFRAQGLPDDTFATTADIHVTETDDSIEFEPHGDSTQVGQWMLLPGCPADPRAYGPLARGVAARGFHSVIVKIPYRCAPWPQHSAELRRRVMELMAKCFHCRWTLAGHSRGVRHVLELVRMLPRARRDEVASLVLIASTHPREDDYSDLPLRVLKILGSEDGVAPLETSFANRALLPAATRFEVIDGGNHAQFGYYGFQIFDGRALISREAQHEQTVRLLVSMLLDNK
ncbi:MAG TPA: alpha/beta hydrolase [Vicinamibacterales bacterium]|nr:alpha/beta hydrolase [Vicinamibacterales bacterium]